MIKISMSLLLYATTCLVHPAQEQHTHALLLVEKIFSTRNLQLAPLSTLFLEDFFYLLATTTPYQQMRACTEATHTLEKEIEIQKTVKSQDEREHTLHILTVQKKHLERCAAILFQTLPWYARLQGWFVNCLDTLCCRVSSLCGRQKLPRISELKDGIIAYTHFEQTEIFSSHIRTLSFLSQNNIHSLPILIRFWDYPRHRHRLLNNVKLIEKGATPQAAGLATIAEETAEDIAAELEAAANAIKQVGQEAAENMSTTALEDTFDDGTSVEGSAEDFFEANTSDKLFYDGADTEGATTQETADSEAALLEEGTGAQVAQYGKILTKTDDAFTAALQADKDLPAVVESQAGQKELLAQMEEDFESTVTEIQDAQRGKWSLAFKNAMQKIEATGHKVSPLEIAFRRIDVAEGRLNGYLESLSKLYKKLPLRSTANQTAKVTSKVQSAAEKQLAAKFEELFGNTPWKKPFTQEQLQAFPGLKKEWELAVKTASKSNWSAEKISQYLQDTIPTKNEVIEAFKSPGTLFLNGVKGIGKAAVWFVVKGATLASKLTIRNIYRYLTKTTWGKMLLSIVEQSEVSMGSQMVISWQNAQEAQEFLVLSRERNALTTALNQFFVSLANQQQLSLNKIDAAFSANAATISQQLCITQTSKGSYVLQGLLPTLLNSQQSALNSALINCTTKQIFLSNQLQDDQLFYLSPMIIPEQESVTGFKSPFNTTWYNPHRSGNWATSRMRFSC